MALGDFHKATPHNGARRFGERFCPKRKYGKCGNTRCISRFSYCTIGAKDPVKPAAPIARCCHKNNPFCMSQQKGFCMSSFKSCLSQLNEKVVAAERLFTLPSCARRSARRHSEGKALGGETENLLQIKQFSILCISKRVRNKFMYITTHLIDFITIIQGRGGLFKPRHDFFVLFFFHHADQLVKTGAFGVGHFHGGLCGDFSRFPRGINLVPVGGECQCGSA